MGNVDTSSKRIIHLYNQAWIEWTLQRSLEVEAELSSDFQFIQRDSDSLLKIKDSQGSFLSLTELQFVYKRNTPWRLVAYAALAREKYCMKVFVTVVYFLPPPKDETVATCFHEEFMGQTAHQDFQVISLWELEAQKALAFNNPAVLPFIPLMQGGNTVKMVQICAERLRQEEHAEELRMFLALLAGYVLDKKLVQQILRLNMEIIENSPVFQDILEQISEKIRKETEEKVRRETEERVRKETEERVRKETDEKSRKEECRNNLLQVLVSRFGSKGESLANRFQLLDLKTVEELFKTALSIQTLAEFENVLNATLSSKAKK